MERYLKNHVLQFFFHKCGTKQNKQQETTFTFVGVAMQNTYAKFHKKIVNFTCVGAP